MVTKLPVRTSSYNPSVKGWEGTPAPEVGDNSEEILKELGYDNLTDARIKLGAMETFRERWEINKDASSLRGSDHQDYIHIDKENAREKI